MSYNDDEELKIGDLSEADDDLDLDPAGLDPLDEELGGGLPVDDDTEEGFADLDGSVY